MEPPLVEPSFMTVGSGAGVFSEWSLLAADDTNCVQLDSVKITSKSSMQALISKLTELSAETLDLTKVQFSEEAWSEFVANIHLVTWINSIKFKNLPSHFLLRLTGANQRFLENLKELTLIGSGGLDPTTQLALNGVLKKTSNLTGLHLPDHGMSDHQFMSIFLYMNLAKIEELTLSKNALTGEVLKTLLSQAIQLRYLDLSGNSIKDLPQHFYWMIEKRPIVEMHLQDNLIPEGRMQTIPKHLPKCDRQVIIRLFPQKVAILQTTIDALQAELERLYNVTNKTTEPIPDVPMDKDEAICHLVQYATDVTRARTKLEFLFFDEEEVSLQINAFMKPIIFSSEAALRALLDHLSERACSIEELDFDGAPLTEACWKIFAKEIHRAHSVQSIIYPGITFDEVNLLSTNQFINRVQSLQFPGNSDNPEAFLDAMIPIIEEGNLKILDLSGHQIGDKGFSRILECKSAPTILILKNCGITDVGLVMLSHSKKSFSEIDLSNNQITQILPLIPFRHACVKLNKNAITEKTMLEYTRELIKGREEPFLDQKEFYFNEQSGEEWSYDAIQLIGSRLEVLNVEHDVLVSQGVGLDMFPEPVVQRIVEIRASKGAKTKFVYSDFQDYSRWINPALLKKVFCFNHAPLPLLEILKETLGELPDIEAHIRLSSYSDPDELIQQIRKNPTDQIIPICSIVSQMTKRPIYYYSYNNPITISADGFLYSMEFNKAFKGDPLFLYQTASGKFVRLSRT